ncbi:L-type lectin-domain containing receptor kinase SIT2-like isoform X1 [Actinidia eriantha]|uniref:L-type lectin-domain containing receptor kinase SIT2-like isoform X1 n=2 Tax=Actinidia eriantha TaxID=165200 RepID=UPI002590905B|nr:L-type lectin-domain containing receptor kinase SIT2-like isoform X1 [Actinidia eriantha]
MTTASIPVYFLLVLLVCIIYLKPQAIAQDENHFIYNDFHGSGLHLDGAAEIQSNGLLQLTNTSQQEAGHAFFPARLNTSTRNLSFSTYFVFAMIPEIPVLGGHGLTFIMSPSMNFTQALPSQYLGILNASNNDLASNHLLVIEFDTIKSPEFNDINDNHVGIDVNSLTSLASAPVAHYSNSDGKNKTLQMISGKPIQVWIDYDQGKNLLNVALAPIESPKPERSLLSTKIDLSQIFLDSMYVGFSAATGAMTSSHYILGWSFSRYGQAQNLELSKLPSLPRQRRPRNKQSLEITISLIVLAVVLVITMGGFLYFVRRNKYEEIREDWEQEYGPRRFSFKDLYKATKGFKDKGLLGTGGFGKVYKGVLKSSKEAVAVKRVSHCSKQGMKEFVAEIASMGRLRHRNLVKLLGYSRRRGELLLVYEYMPNESLDKFLFTNEKPNLNWAQRYRILKGVASALVYLHEEWEQVVLHRDVKASNVLLDADMNGQLGDFGLARLYDHGENPQTTHVVGTVGYLAPELTRTGKATTSTDVFGFGAFLLEVACGRRPIEMQALPEEMMLVDWVFESWKQGAILDTSDPRLGGDYSADEMELVLKLGLLCSHANPASRPSMRQVVQYLDGVTLLPEILLDGATCDLLDDEACAEFVMSVPRSFEKISCSFLI